VEEELASALSGQYEARRKKRTFFDNEHNHRSDHMNFSRDQWLGIIVMDLAFRTGISFVRGPFLFTVIIAVIVSSIFLTILFAANSYIKTFTLRPGTAAALVLVSANLVFFIMYIGPWFLISQSGHVTDCFNYQCTWIDGSMTFFGLRTLLIDIAVQTLVNTVPFLVMWSQARRRAAPGGQFP
jgi:hypothetical protein